MIFDDTPEIPENLISLNEISLSENDFDDTPVIPENLISFEDIVPPDETNTLDDLKIMREKFIQNPLIGYLNINGLTHAHHGDYLNQDKNLSKLDILALSETKLKKETNKQIADLLSNWIVMERQDSDDNEIHMGMLILISKNSNLREDQISLKEIINLKL